MNLIDRAKTTMELLQRAPASDPTFTEHQNMLSSDAVALLDRTLEALDFFEPHFQTYDDLITECRRSLWYRIFNWTKVDGMIRLRTLRRNFTHYRDIVRDTKAKFVDVDPKILVASHGWIEWHEQELRRMSRGPYR